MKIFIVSILFLLGGLTNNAWANPADQDVKEHILSNIEKIYDLSSSLYMSDDFNFDDNLDCFSSYSYRKEIGVCRVSGGDINSHSTFLIIVREEIPGRQDSRLILEVVETSRIEY